MRRSPHITAMVLAGGEGKRLYPLTRDRAKPAVPFGGIYRIVDFVLSNLVNGGYRRISVLTQYKSHSLDRHIARTWLLSPLLGNYVATVPAQMRRGPHWFAGSADAIFQSSNIIRDEFPDHIIVFGADHIYRMDPRRMVEQHMESGAGVTVAGLRVPIEQASAFGIIEAGPANKILSFEEKPDEPSSVPGQPDLAFASMGNYIFAADALMEALQRDASDPDSRRDIGGNIIPAMVKDGSAYVYDFASNVVPGQGERERGYWRDVGTLDAYYEANMDLVYVNPEFDLYNDQWPIYTFHPPLPPAKFVLEAPGRRGQAFNSLLAAGVIVSGGTVRGSVLSPGVRVHSYAMVEDSVLMNGVDVGRNAVIRKAIIDKGVVIPPGTEIGVDPAADAERFRVTEKGVVVIGREEKVE